MSWQRVWFKKGKAYAKVAADGSYELKDGRIQICYKPDDARTYLVSQSNVRPLDNPPPVVQSSKPEKSSSGKAPPDFKQADLSQAENVVHIWTDGACSGNPGKAGCGVVMRFGSHRLEIGHYIGIATNNIAELTAISIALDQLKSNRYPARIYTDSTYSLGVLTKNWKAKKNPELVAEIKAKLNKLTAVEFVKVAGHAGVADNERADQLARAAVETESGGMDRFDDE